MQVETRGVDGGGMVISCATILIPRALAESNSAVPSAERIELAKARFESAGMPGARFLIEALRILEDEESVVGYFGFTIDREGATRTPLAEGETEGERSIKIMRLPHPQWGNRSGTATAVDDLVVLSEDPKLASVPPEQAAILEQMFSEGAAFLARGSSEGES